MKKETEQRELSPAEVWDQLAVSEIRRLLAPKGFKKVYNGKSEVSNIQFLGKQTVNQACVIGANLVRLFRENLKDEIKTLAKQRDQWRVEAEAKLKACYFWQFQKKRQIRDEIMSYAGAGGMSRMILTKLDDIKPSMPKISKGKRQPQKV